MGTRHVSAARAAAFTATLVVGLGLAAEAQADIYLYRDRQGMLHVGKPRDPSDRPIVLKERTMPPPRRGFARAGIRGRRALGPMPVAKRTAYDDLIREIAARYDVEYALVKAVIKAESDFNWRAISPKGARGLMQLMPATAARHRVRNIFLPRDNIEGGSRHLRMLLDRYAGNVPLAVAAYNAGEERVDQARGVPSITETREYLARVLRYRLVYLREVKAPETADRAPEM